ncbi:hypothetical protein YC2023_107881 [Brassica napus]
MAISMESSEVLSKTLAYYKGWHFRTVKLQVQFIFTVSPFGVKGFFDWVYTHWVLLRLEYLAPLSFSPMLASSLFLIQILDRLILCLGCFWIQFQKINPVPTKSFSDLESDCFLPMVLVQVPMCNEKEVYHHSIAAVYNLDWSKTKILIQILDDSD